MKLLLTGSTGQVGTELRQRLVRQTGLLTPSRAELDLADITAVKAYLQNHQPAVIINAAAYTAVDLAETERAAALALNAELPELLARYCAKNGAYLLHYSTDYVYPGTGLEPWREDSPTGPLNYYGQTKLQGDLAVLAHCPQALIFRTSWVYSVHGKNFRNTILCLAKQKTELSIVADQIGAPTPATLIATISVQVLQRYQQGQPIAGGIYHLVPRGYGSWYDFARLILQQAQQQGLSLTLDASGIHPIPSSAYPTAAKRPLNSRLCVDKLEHALGIHLPFWQELLASKAQ